MNIPSYLCWLFCSVITVGIAFASPEVGQVQEKPSDEVQVGQLFSVARKIDLPEEAYPALRLYMKMMVYSRPLPWPYRLRSFDVQKGTLNVQGRLLRPGLYDIPLGVFWWRGTPYVLPSFSYTSISVTPAPLTAADLLLPFPKIALTMTPVTTQLHELALTDNQEMGIAQIRWQEWWRHVLGFAGLFLVCVPLLFQLWRWWRLQRRPEVALHVVTPGMAFLEVKALQQQGQNAWPQLLHTLNLVASESMPSLTSYELEKRFAASGDKKLSEASHLIETFGYRPDGTQYFGEAVQLVEQELTVQKLL